MVDIDPYPIYSVAVEPEFCPQCGTELQTREVQPRTYPFCPVCEIIFSRNPVGAVHIIIKRDNTVLLLDEPIPQHEGMWSLPGGFASYDETPQEAAKRELREETGLIIEEEDLSLLTVYHAETTKMAFHFTTFSVDYSKASGKLATEAEGFELEFVPIEEALKSTEKLRQSDRDRIKLAYF